LADGEVESARGHALRLPRRIAALTAAAWFPGGVIFPLGISLGTGWLSFEVYAHFIASFCLSGLVALAYSLCGAQYIVLRVLYPGMWANARGFGVTAQRELAPMAARLGRIQILAGSIPLVAAVMMLTVMMFTLGRDTDFEKLRYLVYLATALIVFGMFGSHFASAVLRGLSQVVAALTGTKE
jgi:hypothetical protein